MIAVAILVVWISVAWAYYSFGHHVTSYIFSQDLLPCKNKVEESWSEANVSAECRATLLEEEVFLRDGQVAKSFSFSKSFAGTAAESFLEQSHCGEKFSSAACVETEPDGPISSSCWAEEDRKQEEEEEEYRQITQETANRSLLEIVNSTGNDYGGINSDQCSLDGACDNFSKQKNDNSNYSSLYYDNSNVLNAFDEPSNKPSTIDSSSERSILPERSTSNKEGIIRRIGRKLPKHLKKLYSSSGSHRFSKSSPNTPTYTPPTIPSTPTLKKRNSEGGCSGNASATCIMPVKSPLQSIILKNRNVFGSNRSKSAEEKSNNAATEKTHDDYFSDDNQISEYSSPAEHLEFSELMVMKAATNVIEDPFENTECFSSSSSGTTISSDTIWHTSDFNEPFEDVTCDHVVLCSSPIMSSTSHVKDIKNEECKSSREKDIEIVRAALRKSMINTNNKDHFLQRPRSLNLCLALRNEELRNKNHFILTSNFSATRLKLNSNCSSPTFSEDMSSSVSSLNKLILTSTSTQVAGTPSTPPSEKATRPTIRVISPEMVSLNQSSSSSSSTDSNYSSSSSEPETQRQVLCPGDYQSDNLKIYDLRRSFSVQSNLPRDQLTHSIFSSEFFPFPDADHELSKTELNRTIYDVTNSYINLNFPSDMQYVNDNLFDRSYLLNSHSDDSSSTNLSHSFRPSNLQSFRYIDNSSQGSLLSSQSSMYPESFIFLSLNDNDLTSSTRSDVRPSVSGLATPLPSFNGSDKSLDDLNIYLARYGLLEESNERQTLATERVELKPRESKSDPLEFEKKSISLSDSYSSFEGNRNSIPLFHSFFDMTSPAVAASSSSNCILADHFEPSFIFFEGKDSSNPSGKQSNDQESSNTSSSCENNDRYFFKNSRIISEPSNVSNKDIKNCTDSKNTDDGTEIYNINVPEGNTNTSISCDNADRVRSERTGDDRRNRERLRQKRRRLISRLEVQDIEQVLQLYFFDNPSEASLSPLISPGPSTPGSPRTSVKQPQVRVVIIKRVDLSKVFYVPQSSF